MAASMESQPRGSTEFAEGSVLEAIVPASSNVDLEGDLGSWTGVAEDDGGSILPILAQRAVLLLDELVPFYIVFRTPLQDYTILKSYLSRLVVNVEVFAFSTAPSPEHEPKTGPPKELIYSGSFAHHNEPTVINHGEGEHAYTYIFWRDEAFIARPQGRFHKPAVYFQSTASFKPAENVKDSQEDEYLPSRMPTALNLLRSFENDPALAGVHPRLSAMRISKVVPNAPVAREMVRPIRNGQRRIFRVLPALIWRVRYSRLHASINDLSLMASLDLEVAQFSTYDVSVKKVSLDLHGGNVKALADHQDTSVVHKPGDQLTFLYKIEPDLASDGTPALGSHGHYLTLNVNADVTVTDDCQPVITIEWKTPVDFASEHTTGLVTAAHRVSHPAANTLSASNPDALPTHDAASQQEQDASSGEINITLTVSGPPKVRVGELFTWDVFIVNRSGKTRKLAILVIAKRKRDYERHKSHPSTSSSGRTGAEKDELIATAVVDENINYAKQKAGRTETADLVCLTTDIRLGQLSPGSCYTADLKFLALSAGVLSVESIRIIDLATNETADVRDLPSIVAVE